MSKLSLDEIMEVAFHKASIGGYKADEVDAFIDNVAETMEEYEKENAELSRKLQILAKKIEEYKVEEDSIRSTLLNAQKLASASVREAKHKADNIIRDANSMAEDIVSDAKYQITSQQAKLKIIKKEVVNFRTKLLQIYKEHLKLIDSLPDQDDFSHEGIISEEPVSEIEKSDANFTEDELKDIVDRGEANEVLNRKISQMNIKKAKDDMELDEITSQYVGKRLSKKNAVPKETEDTTFEDTEETPLVEEPKTIRFNAIKFGDGYDLSNDNDNENDDNKELF